MAVRRRISRIRTHSLSVSLYIRNWKHETRIFKMHSLNIACTSLQFCMASQSHYGAEMQMLWCFNMKPGKLEEENCRGKWYAKASTKTDGVTNALILMQFLCQDSAKHMQGPVVSSRFEMRLLEGIILMEFHCCRWYFSLAIEGYTQVAGSDRPILMWWPKR